ncbi:MAG: TatD family hydrolase [Candidatus Bathyarchaeota archaeon]|nr:TatD family hydrolase [Candidatus Bathyarchaeota archaeon]
MQFIDAHIHLSDKEYRGYVDELVNNAKTANVVALVSNAMDFESSTEALLLAEKHPELIYVALGIHPWNVNVLKPNELEETLSLIEKHHHRRSVVAIGEIGLDCKYEVVWEKQLAVFDKMLQTAEKFSLPVIIHSRGTTEFIVDMLPSYNLKRVLLHWFSHPLSALQKAIDYGYYITEGPPVVYSNGIREVVMQTPLTNLLTETDGPVLFRKPPFNSQMTKPSFIKEVVQAIADIKKTDVEEVANQIVQNFETFFNLKISKVK